MCASVVNIHLFSLRPIDLDLATGEDNLLFIRRSHGSGHLRFFSTAAEVNLALVSAVHFFDHSVVGCPDKIRLGAAETCGSLIHGVQDVIERVSSLIGGRGSWG